MPNRSQPSVLDAFNWRFAGVLVAIAVVLAIITIFVVGKADLFIVLAIFGGSVALVFLAALIVIIVTATHDPRIQTIVERRFDSALSVVGVKSPSTGIENLIGRTATVLEPFKNSPEGNALGRVRISGENWAARLSDDIRPTLDVGDEVIIAEVDGLTLIVTRGR